MKILTGSLRGKAIQFRPNPKLRPTSDKVRKAIFDMLQGALQDKNVLDLFSGTGALGIEALSAGAARVTFVEMNKNQCCVIKENLIRLGLTERAEAVNLDAIAAIGSFGREGEFYDIIFLDPPYEKEWGARTLEALSKSSIVHEDTLIILECNKREEPPRVVGQLKCVRAKLYGDTQILVYKSGGLVDG